ncbi:hypothetical protein K4L06_13295 [Lysobacter sp. BMK333-48F3]|uniref:hypothetical protein n=1 Tax=Lysobacter sp. BMK333-48F3 TaxID=2867962 RepID=UPI001C8C7678|nr:hypothetical protein [Lysobacter sp. BMK333-48F3]MBX9402284.1 hypothetical protein [Lysobacter sp. BMK333-48F3]
MSAEMLLGLLFLFLFVLTVVLVIKADRLSKWLLVASNIGLAFAALLPTTLVRLGMLSNVGNVGTLAVAYFVFFFLGLLLINWRSGSK